jgi:hypothetical protein
MTEIVWKCYLFSLQAGSFELRILPHGGVLSVVRVSLKHTLAESNWILIFRCWTVQVIRFLSPIWEFASQPLKSDEKSLAVDRNKRNLISLLVLFWHEQFQSHHVITQAEKQSVANLPLNCILQGKAFSLHPLPPAMLRCHSQWSGRHILFKRHLFPESDIKGRKEQPWSCRAISWWQEFVTWTLHSVSVGDKKE